MECPGSSRCFGDMDADTYWCRHSCTEIDGGGNETMGDCAPGYRCLDTRVDFGARYVCFPDM